MQKPNRTSLYLNNKAVFKLIRKSNILNVFILGVSHLLHEKKF